VAEIGRDAILPDLASLSRSSYHFRELAGLKQSEDAVPSSYQVTGDVQLSTVTSSITSTSREQVEDEDDQRQNQQYVNQAAGDMEAETQ
jgi:hypothetical protein